MNISVSIDSLLPRVGDFNNKFMSERLRDLVIKEAELLGHFGIGRKSVLDAGCGDGRNTIRLISGFQARPERLVLFENDLPSLELARRNAVKQGEHAKKTTCVLGNLYSMPFGDESFDFVIGLGDVPSLSGGAPVDALGEMRRVVSQDGVLVFSLIAHEYLLCLAERDHDEEAINQLHRTDRLPLVYAEGGISPHISLGPTPLVPMKLTKMGLSICHYLETSYDFDDIPARLLFACKKF